MHGSLESEKDESKELKRESQLAEELGFSATFMPEVPVVHKPGYRVANQAKFEPLRYLAGLAKVIPGDGSAIYENSEATEFEAEPHSAKVNGKQVRCNYIVIATHVPLMGKTGHCECHAFPNQDLSLFELCRRCPPAGRGRSRSELLRYD